jgi:hypothetical protein
MPIEKRKDETRDEFVSRCVSEEMNSGKPQEQALAICLTYADDNFKSATPSVSDATWSTEAPISIELESYDDYPKSASENAKAALRWAEENGWGDCGTGVGKARANQLASGEAISRDTIARMAAFERHRQNSDKELGDGCGRLMWLAWGGDEGIAWAQKKLEQIDNQKLRSQNLAKQKKVIFNEDFDEEVVREYKDLGYKVYVRSQRKIKKADRKVWNKLKTIGLSEDLMLYGELKDLDKTYKFDLHMTGEDPILEALKLRGKKTKYRRVIDEYPVKSLKEARQKEAEALSKVELKFVSVKIVYQYREIPNIPAAKSGSRKFCERMMQDTSLEYTLEDIAGLDNEHLKKMFANYNLEPDVFAYRGGFYRLPDTLNTTPWCRHEWVAKVVIV